jgi:DNA-binding MarR family transcriptional regulator
MAVSATEIRPEELARNLCDVITYLCLAAPRGRRRTGDLKEAEFLTLSVLHRQRTLIVGDIQRMLGVLPAQMSRVIRSLEDRERPLITCRINPHDKRKIDVSMTPAGVRAFHEHQTARVNALSRVLSRLPEEDLDDLQRLSEKLRDVLVQQPLG